VEDESEMNEGMEAAAGPDTGHDVDPAVASRWGKMHSYKARLSVDAVAALVVVVVVSLRRNMAEVDEPNRPYRRAMMMMSLDCQHPSAFALLYVHEEVAGEVELGPDIDVDVDGLTLSVHWALMLMLMLMLTAATMTMMMMMRHCQAMRKMVVDRR